VPCHTFPSSGQYIITETEGSYDRLLTENRLGLQDMTTPPALQ